MHCSHWGVSALLRWSVLRLTIGAHRNVSTLREGVRSGRTQESRDIEERRTQESRDLEDQRAHETALQNYFEQVGMLLLERPLRRANPGDNLSTVVRAQTLTVLEVA